MNQLQQAGSQQGSYVPLFTDRFFLGLVTNRNKLRSPLGAYYSKFISANDALIDGTNTEVCNRLTLIRRPGNTAGLSPYLSGGNVGDVPDSFYSFHEITGTVRVFIDTPSNVYLLGTSAIPSIFQKGAAAGQAYFQGVGQALYIGDTVEEQKWLDFGSGNPGNSFSSISNTSLTSNVATITAINNYAVGQTVTIQNTTNGSGAFNGTFLITAVTSTTFQYALIHVDIGSASDTGTASATWNWGIVAPTNAPTLTITQTGSSAVNWQANTWFSTMGILIDANGVAEQLVSVNADGSNPSSQYGLSGNGQPAWNQTPGGTTSDNTITWTNYGPVGVWKPSTSYSGFSSAGGGGSAPGMIYDAASGGFYANSYGTAKTSGATKPPFSGLGTIGGAHYQEPNNGPNWVLYGNAFSGSSPNLFKWRPGHVYPTLPPFSGNTLPDGLIIEPYAPPPLGQPYPTNQIVYAQISGGGTSKATPYAPWGAAATPAGVQTIDNQLKWVSLGSSTWAANTPYSAWISPNQTAFNCVVDTAGCLQVCNKTGTSGNSAPWIVWQASHLYAAGNTITDTNGFIQSVTTGGTSGTPTHPAWNTTIGGTTSDNTVTWTNVGYAYGSVTPDNTTSWTNIGLASGATWTANQSYYYPKGGFTLPVPSTNPYGGADILDTNGNVEFTIVTGVSGGSAPAWNATQFGYTTDNTVVWIDNGAIVQGGIGWSTGYSYVYSFAARSVSDPWLSSTTAPLGLGDANSLVNGPLSGQPYVLPAPTGSADATVSTASPAVSFASTNNGAIITVKGFGSTDPQVDTIYIYRTSDGGTTYFLLTKITAPAPIGGVAQPWVFHDAIPDSPNATSDGLQTLTVAPLNHFSDPPPVGLINLVQHLGRIFGSVGATVFCSEGPLVGGSSQPPGNGFTQFNPGQYWAFPSLVTKLVPTASGLFVFTTSDLYIISGGPSATSLFSGILIPGLGLSSFNACTTSGNVIYLLTADNQLVSLDPNMGVSEIGVGIGDKINAISPTAAYVAFLIQGSNDKALYVGNGSTGWFRCNPNLAPDSPISGPVWSPFATIAGGNGCGALAALEYSPGKHALLIGSTSSGNPILVRDSTFTTFSDNGTAYPSWATVGSIVLAEPGQLAELGFITCDFIKTGKSPIVSVLLDEIQDSYLSITAASFSTPNTTYTYTLTSGIALVAGMTITITGMTTPGNNGTFIISSLGAGTFTVNNPNGHTESGQTAIGTQFEPLGGYVSAVTGLPPQDAPIKYGLTLHPYSVFANRFYFLQSINGKSPQASCARHLQIKIDFSATDTVQNECISLTIFGCHWAENG